MIVGGGITGIVLFGGDDNGGGGGGGGDEGGDELEFSAIDERYGALSDSVTSGMDECTEDEVGSGEEEKLTCTGADGVTLTLTTYASDTELAGTRTRVLDGLSEGQMSSRAESGYFYVYDPSSADNASRPNAQLYWDDMASLVSGEYRSPSDAVTYEDLITSWKATAPKVDEPPRGLESGTPLSVFASDRFGIGSCRRIPTLADGEVEELQCKRKAQSVWISYFEDKKAFNTYRNNAKTLARQDGFIVNDTWFDTADPTEAERGKIYGYNDEENNYGWLYVDDTECLCYLQAQSVDSDPYALYTDYFNITE